MSVVDTSEGARTTETRETQMREIYRRYYKKFDGKVYLPRFAVKQGNDYCALDYYRHLVSKVEVSTFRYASIKWDLSDLLKKAKDSLYRITLDEDLKPIDSPEATISESDEQVIAWLVASLSFDYFSFKQLRTIIKRVVDRLYTINPDIGGKLSLVKFELRHKITGFIERETDRVTHAAFDQLFSEKELHFYLECMEARFEIPPKISLRSKQKKLVREDNEQIQRSLFDYVPDDFNEYEKAVALYLDNCPQVLWWYRNLVGPDQFSIQGYRRPRIYPDFVVQQAEDKKPTPSVLVVESKGKHLQGNPDTNYKRSIADYFTKLGHEVPWQQLAKDFSESTFRVQVVDEGEYGDQTWKDELKQLLETN